VLTISRVRQRLANTLFAQIFAGLAARTHWLVGLVAKVDGLGNIGDRAYPDTARIPVSHFYLITAISRHGRIA